MTNVDHELEVSLLGDVEPIPLKFYQHRIINNLDNDNFSNGVRFNTSQQRDYWSHIAGAFIEATFRARPTANNVSYTSASKVSTPCGIYSQLYSCNILANKETVSDLYYLNLLNHIYCLVDWSEDYSRSVAKAYLYSKDTAFDPSQGAVCNSKSFLVNTEYAIKSSNGATPAVYTDASVATGATIAEVAGGTGSSKVENLFLEAGKFAIGNNPQFNNGFLQRINITKQKTYTYNAGAGDQTGLEFTIQIPMSMFSPMFKQMKFPTINIDWEITFQPVTTQFKHWNVEAGATDGDISLYRCQLRLPVLKFPLEYEKIVNAMLMSPAGITKTVVWNRPDVYILDVGGMTNIDQTIVNNVVKPTRIWVVGYNAANLVNDAAGRQLCEPYIFNREIDNANVLIDGVAYYQSTDIKTQGRFYEMLKEEFSGSGDDTDTGAQIAYDEFLTNYKLYCFDVSRNEIYEKDPYKVVSVGLRFTATANTRYYVIIEREVETVFNMAKSNVKISNK